MIYIKDIINGKDVPVNDTEDCDTGVVKTPASTSDFLYSLIFLRKALNTICSVHEVLGSLISDLFLQIKFSKNTCPPVVCGSIDTSIYVPSVLSG